MFEKYRIEEPTNGIGHCIQQEDVMGAKLIDDNCPVA